jgi:SAM-dependent methyltransferase
MPVKCDICSNDTFQKPFDNGSYGVVECKKCKYGKVTPVPSEAELEMLYNSTEYFATHMDYNYDTLTESQIEQIIKETFQLHNSHLSAYLGRAKSLLEIGPGGGFSLKGFERAGLAVKGVETSTSSADFARKRLHLAITQSNLENYQDSQQYDIVMLNHVLEHFVDIHKAMQILTALVSLSGILYMRVPDHDSYDRRAYSDKWPAYLPFHISYFSEQSLLIFPLSRKN